MVNARLYLRGAFGVNVADAIIQNVVGLDQSGYRKAQLCHGEEEAKDWKKGAGLLAIEWTQKNR